MLPKGQFFRPLVLTGDSVYLNFTNKQLERIANNDIDFVVNEEVVRTAVLHTYRVCGQPGDVFRRTTFGPKKEAIVQTLMGPTKVKRS